MQLASHSRAFLFAWLLLMVPCQGQEALLRWDNGDVLPGKLLQSGPGQIRWSSPIFSDDLLVDTNALASIVFPVDTVYPTEAFRVCTISGDVFNADIIGSDERTLQLFSKRYGQVRVERDAVYSLNRLSNPNLAFDGSQYRDWDLALDGPIKDLTYRVYDIHEDWERDDPFPDLSKLTPAHGGRLAQGYLDLGLSGFPDVVSAGLHFAMAFEGRIDISEAGQYRFNLYADDQARLFVDGKPVVEFLENGRNPDGGGHTQGVHLGAGFHVLRVEFLELGGEFKLVTRMIGPNARSRSLVGVNKASGWHRGPGGHMHCNRKRASLFSPIKIPMQFEIDLELTTSASPRFVLALGPDALSAASNEALRLETWDDALVVAQGKVFEPVMTIAQDQHDVRLRLAYASETHELCVYDATGRMLVTVKDVQPTTGESGIFIRNRGEDLKVRRLSVYHGSSECGEQTFDAARARVHLIDGQVLYGRLHVTADGAYVMDRTEMRHRIDLASVDRVACPGVELAATADVAELAYADGAVVWGQVEQASPTQLLLRTAFSDQALTCSLAGASLLRFGPSVAEDSEPNDDMDELFTSSGRLCGRLSFDWARAPLSWHPPGAAKPLRLARTGAARIERNSSSVSKKAASDAGQFSCLLHLKTGEIIPCQVLAYDTSKLDFVSPFITQQQLDSTHVKAIDFAPLRPGGSKGKSSRKVDAWLTKILGPAPQGTLGIDPIRLERALTVPRFNRNRPPSHILVARNGDLKRGRLLGINTQTIQFESKLRKQMIPLKHMARVVNISTSQQAPNKAIRADMDLAGKVRASLADGSIFLFEALESKAGKLIGRSAIYGEVGIPIKSIQGLNIGAFEQEMLKSLFDAWVIRPAREPAFGDG
jgi:hypothetical protein